ncbi:DUF2207 domain-containing protein [Nocardioides sp. Y6]|uniref:DUF2207 domain-containing protein n=1 Tax=Nocardioides malaquae TaxID=2773426 RepID=A0ABR9RUZ8_9ACTN|nr:DUF2207 domain-containing protein [Nocardioides malaquae]MBE7325007.1 DUF2207 domain-containing protein [Nocardioides malaquae]
MRRVLPWLVLLGMLAVVALPAVTYLFEQDDDSGYEPTRITRYNAVFEVDDDGDMAVTETLIVRFPVGDRHGIFRFFDEYDAEDTSVPRVPREVSVTRNGRAEEFERSRQHNGRFHVLKIGDADETLERGDHTYVIRYEIEDVLLDRGDEVSRFYWDLIPAGWAQPIDAAVLTVRLPAAPSGDVRCAEGAGSADNCRARVTDNTITVETDDLEPNTPVTVQADLPVAAPVAESRLVWPVSWSPVLGRWPWLLAIVAIVAVAVGWLGRRIAAPTFEEPPAFPLQYAPPPDLGPAQGAYLLTERPSRHALVATLMHAAERGAVRLERGEDEWVVTRMPDALRIKLDPLTRKVTAALHRDSDRFVAAEDDVEAGRTMQTVKTTLDKDVKEWALREGHLARAGFGSAAGVGVVAAAVVYVILVAALSGTMSVVAMVPGAFAAMGLPVLYPGATTKRTDSGRQLWSQVGGFRRVLSTPSSIERFDFSGREELFTAYLPWAVAFGCAEEWAAKYRTEMASDPPDPVWLIGAPYSLTGGPQSMVDSFSSTVGGAISSYQATQASSSSGGGFSGGGGGGGGGGGSW